MSNIGSLGFSGSLTETFHESSKFLECKPGYMKPKKCESYVFTEIHVD